jgi:7-cyano-7-deazaguanine tRNA-ribosyltransferase
LKLKDLGHLPCGCPVCSGTSAQELKERMKGEREKLLAEHNLWVTTAEMRRVKQAIVEGTLWDLVEARSRAHPAMASALKRLQFYREEIEERSPGYKGRGVFFFSHDSTARPEVTRHVRRLKGSHSPSESKKKLLLAKAPSWRPYSKSNEFQKLKETLDESLGEAMERLQISFFAAPYGVVPLELAETYPLSQTEVAKPLDWETAELTAELTVSYVEESGFPEVLLLVGEGDLDYTVRKRFEEFGEETEKGIHILLVEGPWSKENRGRIVAALKRVLKV